MRVNTLRIPCRDLVESQDFYTNTLRLDKVYGSAESGFVGYRLENAAIHIEKEEKEEFESGRYLGFSLEVSDIREFYEEFTARGVQFSGPPERQSWELL